MTFLSQSLITPSQTINKKTGLLLNTFHPFPLVVCINNLFKCMLGIFKNLYKEKVLPFFLWDSSFSASLLPPPIWSCKACTLNSWFGPQVYSRSLQTLIEKNKKSVHTYTEIQLQIHQTSDSPKADLWSHFLSYNLQLSSAYKPSLPFTCQLWMSSIPLTSMAD